MLDVHSSTRRRKGTRMGASVIFRCVAIGVVVIASTTSRKVVSFSMERVSFGSFHSQKISSWKLPMGIETTIDAVTTTTTTDKNNDVVSMEQIVAGLVKDNLNYYEPKELPLLLVQPGLSNKTHFEWFEDLNDLRIAESERVGLETTTTTSPTGKPLDVVRWSSAKTVLTRGMDSSRYGNRSRDPWSQKNKDQHRKYQRKARKLYQTMKDNGGYLILELDHHESSIVRDMWSTMEAYFSLDHHSHLDRQILEKKDGSHDPQSGYHFSRTYLNKDGVVLPETIQESLGKTYQAQNGIEGSCKLFADICKTIGTLVAGGALEEDLGLMNAVISSLLDEKSGHPFVNVEHRLSQYILPDQTKTRTTTTAKESLISHTDWTLTTCIPLSAIPGLQLWKPDSKEWVVPEDHPDPSKYVVVMAGNWIELLTNQAIPACVHRVVTNLSSKARLSAPFFCRPKEMVFDLFRDRFDNRLHWDCSNPNGEEEDEDDASRAAAIAEMAELFGDLIRFTDGDRDPRIPGCILDVCLYREGDCTPDCYAIEDIL